MSVGTAKASPAPRFDKQRRERILEAAAHLIAERGLHSVRVSDIARAIGTTSGTVHYYFPAKDDVLDSAMGAVEAAFTRQGADLRSLTSARDRLLRLTELQLPTDEQVREEWSIWIQYWTEASLHASLRETHAVYYERWQSTVRSIVERGQRQGEFRDIDALLFTDQFSSLFNGAGTQVMTGTLSVERMRAIVTDFIDTVLVAPR